MLQVMITIELNIKVGSGVDEDSRVREPQTMVSCEPCTYCFTTELLAACDCLLEHRVDHNQVDVARNHGADGGMGDSVLN